MGAVDETKTGQCGLKVSSGNDGYDTGDGFWATGASVDAVQAHFLENLVHVLGGPVGQKVPVAAR